MKDREKVSTRRISRKIWSSAYSDAGVDTDIVAVSVDEGGANSLCDALLRLVLGLQRIEPCHTQLHATVCGVRRHLAVALP